MKYRIQKISVLLVFVLLLSSCSTVDYNRLLDVSIPSRGRNGWLGDFEDHLRGMKDEQLFKETKEKTVGIKILLDKRSLGSKFCTRKFKNLSEIATRKLIENFSEMFKAIHYPPKYDEDIIIEGKIVKFSGGLEPLFIFLFARYNYGVTETILELKDGKTGKIIAKLKDSSTDWSLSSWYFDKYDITYHLNDSFSETILKLKARCLWELKKYYSNKQMAVN
jgi:hypothetical protein